MGLGGSSATVAPAPPTSLQDAEARLRALDTTWDLRPVPTSPEEMERRIQALMLEPNVQKAFEKFDVDGSGTVSGSEIVEILNAAGSELEEDEVRTARPCVHTITSPGPAGTCPPPACAHPRPDPLRMPPVCVDRWR